MVLSEQYALKLAALLPIFAVGVAGGYAAFGAQQSERREILFAQGSAFAAGIFLGAGLIHLLPDGIEALTGYFGALDFPLGFFIATLGFLVVVYIEMVYLAGRHHAVPGDGHLAITAYALVIILSIHSLLAGAALGTENTLIGSLVIFIAIIAHKGAAGFALVVEFQRSGFERSKAVRLLLTFAAMTPLGILFGLGLDHLLEDRHGRLLEGIFDCLAAGTFLYIAIIEIIGKEFTAETASGLKFMTLCAGLGVMGMIALWV